MTVRVMIADDHAVFRRSLRMFLEKGAGFEIVAEAGDGAAVMAQLKKNAVDVLLLDITMPGPPCSEVIEKAKKMMPAIRIVILTMHDDEWYLRDAFKAGASAFVLKKSSADDLVSAIHAVRQNNVYVDPALTGILISSYIDPPAGKRKPGGSLLTNREDEILKLLAFGHTNEQIADKLFISKRTVETHRSHIMEKLNLKTRAELVGYALEKGFLQPVI